MSVVGDASTAPDHAASSAYIPAMQFKRRLAAYLLALSTLTACGDEAASTATSPEPEFNPVNAADGPRDYPSAELPGVLTLTDGCLALDGNATLWPAGTRWDIRDEAVVLVDGSRLAVGDNIELSGGLVPALIAANYSDTALEPIEGCMDVLGTTELALISGA